MLTVRCDQVEALRVVFVKRRGKKLQLNGGGWTEVELCAEGCVDGTELSRDHLHPARSEESADLLGDWVQVDVVETGSGRQTGHGAHLRGTPKKQLYLKAKFFLEL